MSKWKLYTVLTIFLLSISFSAADQAIYDEAISEEFLEGTAVEQFNLTEMRSKDEEDINGFDELQLESNPDAPETGHIVELADDRRGNNLVESMEIQGFNVEREFETLIDGFVVQGLSDADVENYEALANVENIYEEQVYHPQTSEGIGSINADELDDLGFSGVDGDDVRIAVVDTGVDYTHPDLGGCSESDFESDPDQGSCEKVIGGYDFVDDNDDPMDSQGHGTHVAGISSADGDLEGVAPGSEVLAYRVLSAFGGTSGDIISGIEQAVQDDADIIGLSLGGPGNPDDALSNAVDDANSEALAVVAAGNDGEDLKTIGSPGAARNALTVGATDYDENVTSFSSRGPVKWWEGGHRALSKPDVTAPGSLINSTYPDDSYNELSGTSMATPIVSGLAALFMEVYQGYDPEEVKSMIKSTSSSGSSLPWRDGAGFVDTERFFEEKGLIVDPVRFEHIDADTDESITINIENPSNDEFNLDYGFGTIYNVTDTDNVEKTSLDPENDGSLSISSGETEQLTLTLNLPKGYYSGYFWLNDTSRNLHDARPFTTAVGDLQDETEISVSLENDGESVYPITSHLYNESGFVDVIDADGEPVGVEAGDYTYVGGYNSGLTDFLVGSSDNFFYVEEFSVGENERYEVSQDISTLNSVTFGNSYSGKDLFLQSTTFYYEKGDANFSIANPVASIAKTGAQEYYYGGDLNEIDRWSFGAVSRDYSKDWDGEVLIEDPLFLTPSDEYLEDWTLSSEVYVDRWTFNEEADMADFDYDFQQQGIHSVENNALYSPHEHPGISFGFTYDEKGPMEVVTAPFTMFPQETTVMYEEQDLELYDPVGDWVGFNSFNENISVGDDLGGQPALPSEIEWQNNELSYDDGVLGHEDSYYFTEDGSYSVEAHIVDDNGHWSEENVTYWRSFNEEAEGESVEFNFTLPTDFDLQTETSIVGVLEDEGVLPRVTNIGGFDPVSSDGWSSDISFTGDEAWVYVRESGGGWSLEDSSESELQVDVSGMDSLDLKVEIIDGNNHVNYTFENLADEREDLSVSYDSEDDELVGSVLNVDSLLLDNVIGGEVEEQAISAAGFEITEETCSYFSQRLQANQVLNYHLNYTFQESSDFDPSMYYNNDLYYTEDNLLDFNVLDSCEFDFKLEINDSGSFANETINVDGGDDFDYTWSNDENLEGGDQVNFRLWMGEDEDWFKSDIRSFEIYELDDALDIEVELSDSYSDLYPELDWTVELAEESLDTPDLDEVDYNIELINTESGSTVEDVSVSYTDYNVDTELIIGEEYRFEVEAMFEGDVTMIHSDTFEVNEDVSFSVEDSLEVDETADVNVDDSGEILEEYSDLNVSIEREDGEWSKELGLEGSDSSRSLDQHFVPRRDAQYSFVLELALDRQDNLVFEEARDVVLDQSFEVEEFNSDKTARPIVNETFDAEFIVNEFYADSADINTGLDFDNRNSEVENRIDDISGETYNIVDSYLLENVTSESPGDSNIEIEAVEADNDSTTVSETKDISFYEPFNVSLNVESDISDSEVRFLDPETSYNKSVSIDRDNVTVPNLFDQLNYSYSFEHSSGWLNLTFEQVSSDFHDYLNASVSEDPSETSEEILHQEVGFSGSHNFEERNLKVEKRLEPEEGGQINLDLCTDYGNEDCIGTWSNEDQVPELYSHEGVNSSVSFEENDTSYEAFRVVEVLPSDEEDDNGGGSGGFGGGSEGPEEEDFVATGIESISGGFEVVGLENARQEDLEVPGYLTFISNLEFDTEESTEHSRFEFYSESFSSSDYVFYDGFNVVSENLSAEDVEIEFEVSNNWISDQEAENSDIRLFEDSSGWSELDTSFESSNNISSIFSAEISQDGYYAVGTEDPCPAIEVEAVDEDQGICRVYTSVCDLPDNYTEVDSCSEWREKQEIEQEIEEAKEEIESTDTKGGSREDNSREEILEEAEQALEAGDLERAEKLAHNVSEEDEIEESRLRSILEPLHIAGFVGAILILVLIIGLVRNYREAKGFKVPESESNVSSEPRENKNDAQVSEFSSRSQDSHIEVDRNVKIRTKLIKITDEIRDHSETDSSVARLLESAYEAREKGNYAEAQSLIDTIEDRLDYL